MHQCSDIVLLWVGRASFLLLTIAFDNLEHMLAPHICGQSFSLLSFLFLQGVLGHSLSPVRQVFERIPSASAAGDAESRFLHFKKHAWLRIKESGASGLCSSCCPDSFHPALLPVLSIWDS